MNTTSNVATTKTEDLQAERPVVSPCADIVETPEAYLLMLDMPGATKEGITLRVEQGALSIEAPVEPVRAAGGTVLFSEIRTGRYSRTFTIGEGIDRNAVDARYEDGVLTVTLRKSEHLKPREITIR